VTGPLAAAVLFGLALGLGLWSIVSTLPALDRPRLVARVAPYVQDVSAGAREYLDRTPANPLPVVGLLFDPLRAAARRVLAALPGGSAATVLRLRQAGSGGSLEAFRSRQLVWAAGGAAAGLVLAVGLALSQPVPVPAQLVLVVAGTVAGVAASDALLKRAARRRLARMTNELPTVLEFLALSLSAGEGLLDALRRVAAVSRGELARELRGVVTAVSTGLPLGASLTALEESLQLPPLGRAIEQITGALERGSPLVEVLRAQAQDARDEAKRDLLESAGKKEVAMLVPLVFLILPITVLFALWPGVFVLQVGF
jgi:tight adherence protein C